MLQEAIRKVQKAEGQAEEILNEARKNGAKMIEDARQEAKLLLDQTKEKSLAEANRRLEKIKSETDVFRQEYMTRLEAELKQSKEDMLQQKDKAVKAIVEMLL